MKPVKLGIIGCGIAARELHWPALQQLRNEFIITYVCNHTEGKARDFSQMVGGVPYILNYEQLLAKPDVEAVLITVPIHLNYPVCKQAMLAGKHVLVEKPLAATREQAEELRKLAANLPIVTLVGENFRYWPILRKVKSLLESDAIGRPYAVEWMSHHYLTTDNKYARTQWRLKHEYAGGFITDGGVHHIAGLRMLFGDITAGRAVSHSVRPEIGEMDTFIFLFSTQSSVIGTLSLYYSAAGMSENRLLIYGTSGTISATGDTIRIISTDGTETEERIDNDGGYTAQLYDFYHAIQTGQPVISSFDEGYQDIATILAAVESAQNKTEFTLVN